MPGGVRRLRPRWLCGTDESDASVPADSEIKSAGRECPEGLSVLAQAALAQIRDKKYEHGPREAGVAPILAYGVAFRGRDVAVELGVRQEPP